MKNPTGIIYRISNFDIEDELGRNFAFTAQDIADRTGAVVIDNGAFDADGDGRGDLATVNRVALGTGRVIDTNGNGRLDERDKRVIFDAEGNHVGVTLRDALRSIGLKRFVEPLKGNENEKPGDREKRLANRHPDLIGSLSQSEFTSIIRKSTDLTEEEQENSYSVVFTEDGIERVFRIREAISRNPEIGEDTSTDVAKAWEILTATGIDRSVSINEFVLSTDEGITLAFVQDLDEDRLPDMLEA